MACRCVSSTAVIDSRPLCGGGIAPPVHPPQDAGLGPLVLLLGTRGPHTHQYCGRAAQREEPRTRQASITYLALAHLPP
jgi:hypothetical protein